MNDSEPTDGARNEQRIEEEKPVSCSGCIASASLFGGLLLIILAVMSGETAVFLPIGGVMLIAGLVITLVGRLAWDALWPLSAIVRLFIK